MARLIAAGGADALVNAWLTEIALTSAFAPAQGLLQANLKAATVYFARADVVTRLTGGVVKFGFNILNPAVIDAVRQLDTKVMQTLQGDAREAVRAWVENGLRDGLHPMAVARDLRAIVGLAPNQAAAVRNFRRLLEAGDREALTRALRDHRFDATLAKALGHGGAGLSTEQIDRMVGQYERRMLAFHADTVSRTATLDALKMGQRLTWQNAIDRGDVGGDRLRRRWSGVRDSRERPEHWLMDDRADAGESHPMDEAYSNGELVPGESTWNCRCLDSWFLASAGQM